MSESVPEAWLERVSASLREHEDRHRSIQSVPPRYEPLGEIGRGGMGIVYRAWDPILGRDVALKVLRPEDGKVAEVHERFEREGRLAARLQHPHIVQVYDSGTWEGQNYIAMQLVEGTTLEQAKPSRREAVTYIRDAARALQFAHDQGIVHRDIKPGNLLLDQSGRVYLTDFGVARQVVASATMTCSGTVVGTPAYMSPEQAQGLPVDARSDVYSLGATLYELTVGRPPFEGKDGIEVLEAVRSRAPERPRRVAPDLSKNIEAIILRAMERSREDRYQTAGELADDIDRYLGGMRPRPRPQGLWYWILREFVRHPVRTACILLFAALVLATGTAGGLWLRASHYFRLAEDETDLVRKEEDYRIASLVIPEARIKFDAYRYFRMAQGEPDSNKKKEYLSRASAYISVAGQQLAHIQAKERKAAADAQAAAIEFEREKNRKDQADAQKRYQAIDKAYSRAQELIKKGDFKEARKWIDGNLQKYDPNRYQELDLVLRTQEWQSSVDELKRLALRGESSTFASQYEALKASSELEKDGGRATLSDPVFVFAERMAQEHQFEEAVRWFDEAQGRLGKNDAGLFEKRGLALVGQGNLKRAGEDFDELRAHSTDAARLPEGLAEVPYTRAREARQSSRWKDALGELDLTLKINPRYARAHHDRGIIRFRLKESIAREALREDLAQALAMEPALLPEKEYVSVALAFIDQQARMYYRWEDGRERAAAWQEAISLLVPLMGRLGSPELHQARARMDLRLGQYKGGLEEIGQAGTGAESLMVRGRLLYGLAIEEKRDRKLLGDAFQAFDRGVLTAGKDPLAFFWRGTIRTVLGEFSAALEDFTSAERLGFAAPYMDYERAVAHLKRAVARPEPDDLSNASSFASRALESSDRFGEEDYLASHLETKEYSWSQAIRLFRRDAYLVRGEAQSRRGDVQTSSSDFAEALRLDPSDSNAHLWAATVACSDGRHKEAQDGFRLVMRISADPQEKGRAKELLAKCLRHSKD